MMNYAAEERMTGEAKTAGLPPAKRDLGTLIGS